MSLDGQRLAGAAQNFDGGFRECHVTSEFQHYWLGCVLLSVG